MRLKEGDEILWPTGNPAEERAKYIPVVRVTQEMVERAYRDESPMKEPAADPSHLGLLGFVGRCGRVYTLKSALSFLEDEHQRLHRYGGECLDADGYDYCILEQLVASGALANFE
jgi:hypothetical protein